MKTRIISATTLIIISAVFSSSAFAGGAEFMANPFIGVGLDDNEGNFCLAINAPPTNDLNDFIRLNPNGESLLKFQDVRAAVTVFTSGGLILSGIGQYTATFHGHLGGKNQGVQFTATAHVDDGVVFAQVVCKFNSNSKGVEKVNTIKLH